MKRVKILDFVISGCILYTKISRMVIFGLVFLLSLRKLKNNGEMTDAEFKAIRSKNARLAKVSGLAKIHKEFDNIPRF